MKETVLECIHLKKKLGHRLILKDINLTLNSGEIYGLIGENGAGKTTTLKIITGLMKSDAGKICLFGNAEKLSESRKQIGALVELPALFPNMSAYQNLKTLCIQNGYSYDKIVPILHETGLNPNDKTKAQHYSLGMKQRLGIAMSLLGNPSIVILDEPLNGLDPSGIFDFKNLISNLNQKRNISFLISSHMLTELFQMSTKFGFIQDGITLKQLSKEELSGQLLTYIHLFTDDSNNLYKIIQSNYPQIEMINIITDKEISLYTSDKKIILELLDHFSSLIKDTQYHTESLENFYIRTISKKQKEVIL